jgi:ABC-type nitrate/sulfonate/bicarbonate transport system ATPase subunit
MARGAGVEVSIASKRFRTLSAPLFEGLRFTIEPATTTCLLGPSGIGKSTLLRMIAGLDAAFEGQILIDGAPPATAPVPGFVFQDARLLPWASALGNLLAIHADPRAGAGAERARALLAEVGLAGFETALPRELSGGMQRRVGLARALFVEPRLLLLDEPFASLDRKLVEELRGLLLRLALARASTMILVSHDAEDAARLAHRVLVLAGRPAGIARDLALDPAPEVRSAGRAAEIAAMLRDLAGGAARTGAPVSEA